MRVGEVASTLLGVAAVVITLGGCIPGVGPAPPDAADELMTLDQVAAIGLELEPGQVVQVRVSDLTAAARAELLDRNPALATAAFMDTVIQVAGGPEIDQFAARGGRLCHSSRYWISHNPGCPGREMVDSRRVNFFDTCPHRGYEVDNPGKVVEVECSQRSCPYLSSYSFTYHQKS